jgi:hypothetical protein
MSLPLPSLFRRFLLAFSAFSTLTLGACSSSDPSPFNLPPPPGIYGGAVYNNLGANAHRFVIRADGSFWILLGVATPGVFTQSGFVQGADIYRGDYAVGTLYDTLYPAGVLVNMNTLNSGGISTFAGNLQMALSGANSTFDGQNASLSSFSPEGLWTVQDAAGMAININISAGLLSATTQRACVFSGSLLPTILGGFFELTLSDPSGCLGPAFITYRGIGLTETPPVGGAQQILLAAIGAGRGVSLSGVR